MLTSNNKQTSKQTCDKGSCRSDPRSDKNQTFETCNACNAALHYGTTLPFTTPDKKSVDIETTLRKESRNRTDLNPTP